MARHSPKDETLLMSIYLDTGNRLFHYSLDQSVSFSFSPRKLDVKVLTCSSVGSLGGGIHIWEVPEENIIPYNKVRPLVLLSSAV